VFWITEDSTIVSGTVSQVFIVVEATETKILYIIGTHNKSFNKYEDALYPTLNDALTALADTLE
jgi:hypothetical protein